VVKWISLSLLLSILTAADFGDVRNVDSSHTKTHFTADYYRSLPEWRTRRAVLQKQILSAAGLWPMGSRGPVVSRRYGRIEAGSFFIEKVAFEALPAFPVGANLYLPKSPNGGAVLVAHGHWKRGRVHDAEDYSVPALCANLARHGYVALAYDMVGYGDTLHHRHEFGGSREEQAWSYSPLGLQLRAGLRAVDFLVSLPQVDANRITMTGASGGATQTILLTAVDERIAAAAPVNMVSENFQGNDACEMAPGLRVGTNNIEIAAMAAPRPMLIVSATKDWTRNTPDLVLPAVAAIYKLFGKVNLLRNAHFEAKHNYNRATREALYAFLGKPGLVETQLVFDPKLLLIGEPLCGNCGDGLALWRDFARSEVAKLDPVTHRELLRAVIGAEWPRRVEALHAGGWLLLQRGGTGERIPAHWKLSGEHAARTVVVDAPESTPALHISVYQTGAAIAPRGHAHGDFLTYHRTDDQYRIQDILTALSYVSRRGVAPRLICGEKSREWCIAAAAIAPIPIELQFPETATPPLWIPGLERAGGMAALKRLAVRH